MTDFSNNPRPPRKRGDLRLVIGFSVAGVLVWLVLVLAGVIFYQRDERTSQAMDVAGKTWLDVVVSPYTTEARALKSIGCESANIIEPGSVEKRAPYLLITCQVMPWRSAPSCKEVARAYLENVEDQKLPFVVAVQKIGRECVEGFAPDGSPLKDAR